MPKISSYPDGGALQSGDYLVVARAGSNRKIAGSAVGGAGISLGAYQIVTSIVASDLVVALKNLDGDDFSAGSPLEIRLADTQQSITSALSVTKADGTSWANLGSDELATKEVDLFTYLILETGASAGVKLGWSRIPYGTTVADFSSTTTDEKYLAGPTNYNATDKVQNIGRFNAILSAGAGYTWSLPATSIIRNEPIYETRVLSFTPQPTNLTFGSGTIIALYQFIGCKIYGSFSFVLAADSSVSGTALVTMPFGKSASYSTTVNGQPSWVCRLFDATAAPAFQGIASMTTTGTVVIAAQDASGTYVKQANLTASVPFTWTTSDQIAFDFDYLAD